MKKEVQIILLPTDKASNVFLQISKNTIDFSEKFQPMGNSKLFTNQFHYVLSDLDIQEGDWVFDLISNSIYQITNKYTLKYFNTHYPDSWKKIIATNDLQLGCSNDSISHLFPQLSQQGLELLCKLYNEKKELKVMVEYEEIGRTTSEMGDITVTWQPIPNIDYIPKLKVDSQNCISISEVEEDVEKLADNWVLSNSPNRNIRTDGDLATGFVAGYKAAKQSKE